MPRGYYNTEQEKQFDMFHLTEKCQFMLEAGIINNLSATKNVLQVGKKLNCRCRLTRSLHILTNSYLGITRWNKGFGSLTT